MFVKNCWYVAAWDHEILKDKPFSRTIAGEPVVFWRTGSGDLVALRDRCAHRGAPLSMGRLEDDGIRCLYHGLKFGPDGRCIDIPSQSTIPDRARVPAYAVEVAHRWVWIWMGDPALADRGLIPHTPWLDHPDWRCQPDYLHYDAPYLSIADNLLDFSHLPFLHPTSLGGGADYATVLPSVEQTARGVRLAKWVRGTQPPAYSARFGGVGPDGLVDRWMFYDFLAPGILLMDSGMRPSGGEPGCAGQIAFRGCQALTPEMVGSTHYFFAHCHDFGIDDPAVTTEIHQGILTAFAEDRDMIAAQQKNLELDPSFKMMPLAVDAGLQQFRAVIGKLLKEEAAG